MMKQEFEDRYGREVNGEVYERIEALYMAQNIDKDTFVKSVKRNRTVEAIQAQLIEELSKRLNAVTWHAKHRKAQADKAYEAAKDKGIDAITITDPTERRRIFGHNNNLMALTESVEMARVLEILGEGAQ